MSEALDVAALVSNTSSAGWAGVQEKFSKPSPAPCSALHTSFYIENSQSSFVLNWTWFSRVFYITCKALRSGDNLLSRQGTPISQGF